VRKEARIEFKIEDAEGKEPHGVTSQKTPFFDSTVIFAKNKCVVTSHMKSTSQTTVTVQGVLNIFPW
jgi:hypothetical protein